MLDIVRSRFIYKSLDAVLTASLRPRRRFFACLKSILSRQSSNYNRIATVANLMDLVVPGSARHAAHLLYRPRRLPFTASRFELLAYGSGSTVFRFTTDDGQKILKIYRKSLGKKGTSLWQLAGMFKRKYETLHSWYGGPLEIMEPAAFLILHGPVLGHPAVVCLQSYVEGEKKDFLADFSDDDLIQLLRENEDLRRQFIFFARKTLEIHSTWGLSMDLLGEGNLLLVRHGDLLRLRLIDYGIHNTERLKIRKVHAQREARILRLQSLLEEITTNHNRV
jgi:hypothetical protein